ncbi:MAG: hypothetical protein KAH91_00070 [Thermoplasmatales archaeon]|nr:hypothetical protein [Thermoplasmatales archaeon]MCK5635785.1 hypothetical protein [Thermoplasmatales archaeon]
MDIASWLFKEIEISRHFQTQTFYIFMLFFTVFAVYLAKRYRLFRFSMLLWLSVALIGLVWEILLFISGMRHYSFLSSAELLYHAITEGGPGMIIITIFADKVGIIDLSDYKEQR